MRALGTNGVLVDNLEANGATRDLGDESGGDGGVLVAGGRIHTALVAQGGLTHEREVARGAARVGRREGRTLQEHIGRCLGDLAVEAAHDARKGDRVLSIGDERHVAGKRAFLAIERRELLAIARGTHAHVMLAIGALGKGAQVEGVQGLAQLEEDVVADVDDVVDGTGAQGRDALDEPLRRGADLHVADDASRIARAQLGVVDLDRDEVAHVLGIGGAGHVTGRIIVPRDVVHGAHLAGKSLHREAVGAVGRNLEIEHRVGQATPGGKRLAQGRVLGQLHDALMAISQVELAFRADHAAALDTAQLRLLDLKVTRQNRADGRDGNLETGAHVGRSAHDLRRFGAIAKVDGRDVHVIAIGMRLAGLNEADLHTVEVGTHLLDALDAGSSQIEPVAEVLQGIGHLDHRVKPFQ